MEPQKLRHSLVRLENRDIRTLSLASVCPRLRLHEIPFR